MGLTCKFPSGSFMDDFTRLDMSALRKAYNESLESELSKACGSTGANLASMN